MRVLLLGFSAIACVLTGYWLNVYGKVDSARIPTILRDSFRQVGYSALALVVFVYRSAGFDTSRFFLFLFILLSWFPAGCSASAARNLIPVVRREFGVKRYMLIVGLGERAERLARNLEDYYEHGLRIVGFLALPGESCPRVDTAARKESTPSFRSTTCARMMAEHVIDEIHFAVESDQLPSLEEFFSGATKKACAAASRSIFSPTSTATSRWSESAARPC